MKKQIPIAFICFIPSFFFLFLINYSQNTNDIWFLFSHGKYILSHGFPHIEFLTLHHNLHFVMQQWLFSFLLYGTYRLSGDIGVLLFITIFNILFIYMTYRLCMVISSNNTFASSLITAIIDILLKVNGFIVPRPQIASLLFLVCSLYLLERFIKEKNNKTIYYLPLVSLLLINFHASLWLMLFIFSLPYLVELFYLLYKNKDKRIWKLIKVLILSFLIGIINPYTWENMFYSLYSYGIPLFNKTILEMHSFSLTSGKLEVLVYSIGILVIIITEIIVWFIERKKYPLHFYFLFLGCSFLALLNFRNLSLLMISAIPYLVISINQKVEEKIPLISMLPFVVILFFFFLFQLSNNHYHIEDYSLKKHVQILNKKDRTKIKLYTGFNDGSYFEYYNYKPYIDSRAEIFIKKMNHQKDIFQEYNDVKTGKIELSKFIKNYQFTHLLVTKDTYLYHYLNNSDEYKIISKVKEKVLFEKKGFE